MRNLASQRVLPVLRLPVFCSRLSVRFCVAFPCICSYMHERGLGTSAPDFHLAKRFYDSCLATDSEAIVPVKLALAHLYARAWWQEYWGGDSGNGGATAAQKNAAASSGASPAASGSASSSSPSGAQSSPGVLSSMWSRVSSVLPPALTGWWTRLRAAQSAMDLFLSLEDVILAVLCAGLAVIVYVRSQR